MILKEYVTDLFKLSIYECYAIFSIQPEKLLNNESLTELRSRLKEHYQNNPFVIIREEFGDLDVDLSIYETRTLKNLKGLAIVSKNEATRERAMKEQSLFDNSFAFFPELESAIHWAKSYFR